MARAVSGARLRFSSTSSSRGKSSASTKRRAVSTRSFCSSFRAKSIPSILPEHARRSIDARRTAAVDGDRRALDVTGAIAGEEDGERRHVFGLPEPADALLGDGVAARLLGRDACCGGTLLEQRLDALGLRQPGQDGVDVYAVALAQP